MSATLRKCARQQARKQDTCNTQPGGLVCRHDHHLTSSFIAVVVTGVAGGKVGELRRPQPRRPLLQPLAQVPDEVLAVPGRRAAGQPPRCSCSYPRVCPLIANDGRSQPAFMLRTSRLRRHAPHVISTQVAPQLPTNSPQSAQQPTGRGAPYS